MRIFADIVRLKISRWGHPAQSEWAPSSRASVLLRDKDRNTEEKATWRRKQKQESQSHKPMTLRSHQKLEEAREDLPLGLVSKERLQWPCWHFNFAFPTSRTIREHISVFQSHHGPSGSDGEEYACNAGEQALIPGLGRFPGEGNGDPLQYSCLVNPKGRGAWRWFVVAVLGN